MLITASVPRDPLWSTRALFQSDANPDKIDLIVGVYKDEAGDTPVMRAVHLAELELAAEAKSKAYGNLDGNAAFNRAAAELALGAGASALGRSYTMQTVGCTGALRVLMDFVATANPHSAVWASVPGYVNHAPVVSAAGLPLREFDWAQAGGRLDIDAVLRRLKDAAPGDILLLQACCHNPTGIDPSPDDWRALADFVARQGLVPLIDISYQGLGQSFDEDAAGLRLMAETLDCVLIGQSFSKNMGLYNERVGTATVIHAAGEDRDRIAGLLELLTRRAYSMPPEHGAAVVARIMHDPDLHRLWRAEITAMQARIRHLRETLAARLMAQGAPHAFAPIGWQNGMFSRLPMSAAALARLRHDHSVYITDDGRMNIAGLQLGQIDRLSEAIIRSLAAGAPVA